MLSSRLASCMASAALAAACVISCFAAMPAFAWTAESIDLTAKGSISIVMRAADTHEVVPGGELNLYRVAEVAQNDADLSFALTRDFADSGASLQSLDDPELAAALAQYAQERGLTASKQAVSQDGQARFSDLSLGLYLVTQTVPAKNCSPVLPFLVTVPMLEDAKWVYNVDASPKVELVPGAPEESNPPEPEESNPPEPEPKNPSNPAKPSEPTKPTSPLPQTGQLLWPVPVLAGTGCVFLLVGGVLLFARQGRKR